MLLKKDSADDPFGSTGGGVFWNVLLALVLAGRLALVRRRLD